MYALRGITWYPAAADDGVTDYVKKNDKD